MQKKNLFQTYVLWEITDYENGENLDEGYATEDQALADLLSPKDGQEFIVSLTEEEGLAINDRHLTFKEIRKVKLLADWWINSTQGVSLYLKAKLYSGKEWNKRVLEGDPQFVAEGDYGCVDRECEDCGSFMYIEEEVENLESGQIYKCPECFMVDTSEAVFGEIKDLTAVEIREDYCDDDRPLRIFTRKTIEDFFKASPDGKLLVREEEEPWEDWKCTNCGHSKQELSFALIDINEDNKPCVSYRCAKCGCSGVFSSFMPELAEELFGLQPRRSAKDMRLPIDLRVSITRSIWADNPFAVLKWEEFKDPEAAGGVTVRLRIASETVEESNRLIQKCVYPRLKEIFEATTSFVVLPD